MCWPQLGKHRDGRCADVDCLAKRRVRVYYFTGARRGVGWGVGVRPFQRGAGPQWARAPEPGGGPSRFPFNPEKMGRGEAGGGGHKGPVAHR